MSISVIPTEAPGEGTSFASDVPKRRDPSRKAIPPLRVPHFFMVAPVGMTEHAKWLQSGLFVFTA